MGDADGSGWQSWRGLGFSGSDCVQEEVGGAWLQPHGTMHRNAVKHKHSAGHAESQVRVRCL